MPKMTKEEREAARLEKKQLKQEKRKQKKKEKAIKLITLLTKLTMQVLVFIFMLVDTFSDNDNTIKKWAFIALAATVVLITLMIITLVQGRNKPKKQLKIVKKVFSSLIYVFVLLYYFGEYVGGEEIIQYFKYVIIGLEFLIGNFWCISFLIKRHKKKTQV